MLSGKHEEVTRNRLGIFTSSNKKEVNLWSKLYKSLPGDEKPSVVDKNANSNSNSKDSFSKASPSSLKVYSPSMDYKGGRISFEEALKGTYKDAKVGDKFGPSW